VSCPPINQRIPKDVLYEAEDSVFVYEMMLKRAFEVNNAKLAVVFEGAGVCFRGGSENQFRSYIVNNNLLDTVISLPANILYGTSISCVLLVCKKDRAKNAPITLVCGENYFVINDERKRILDVKRLLEVLESGNSEDIVKVTIDDIVNEDYNISPSIYQKEPVDCPEGHVLSRLGEIVEMPKSAIATARDMGLFVSISDLSKDWTQPDITSSLKVERNIRGSFKLTQKAVLISSYNGLKPSIVDASEEAPVWIHPHIMILIPKDNIDMGFLCMTLAKQKVPTFGSAQQYIPKTYLLRLEITYPTLDVQKSIYKEACYAYKLSQAKEIGLLEIIEQMKKDYINEVRERKHDMKTPLGQLKSTLTLIEYMAKSLPKESAEQLLKYVEKQKKAMGTLEELVSHIADEDHFAKPEVLNVEELLKGYVEKTDKYVIDYHCDKLSLSEAGIEVPQVKMGKLDFLRLAGNIVSNAIQRGFTKNYPEYALNITLSVNGDFFVIDFSNNGEPLPNGMDKERYGTKGAKGVDSNGTGTGGYIVKSITRHYGGDYDVHSIKLMGMNFTNIIVKLPIYRGEDE
jgi:type I restriction enzyme M protein